MPVTPPGPGDIVTVPDPVTGGAGAAVTTTEVINAMWRNAQEKSAAGDARVGQAITIADPAPHLVAPYLDKSYLPPLPPELIPENPNDAEARYNATRDQLIALITSQFRGFIDEFFPRPDLFEDAMDWCGRAINNGGTGLNPAVEAQLFERAKARIQRDTERQRDESMTTWANRRWKLPPGSLNSSLVQIELEGGRKLAEANRDIWIKSFDTEIENVRFAVQRVLEQRKVALDAAGDYIRVIMQGPTVAMQLTTGLAGLRTEFARSMTALYSAQVTALEPIVRLNITDAQLQLDAAKANLQSDANTLDAKVRAALAGAQMVASMATAGINAINAQASISGNDSSSV